MTTENFLIVGAGLVGSLLAMYAARHGRQVEVYELRPDPRRAAADTGRSINLTLCQRGFDALERVGIADRVREISIPAYGRVIHHPDGEVVDQPYGNRREAIYCVERGRLNALLLDLAEEEFGVRFEFGWKCVDVDPRRPEVVFERASPCQQTQRLVRSADRIFAADGAFSSLRYRLQKTPRFDLSQQYVGHAYKELTLPADSGGSWRLENEALHIWPRGHYMLIGFPNLDGSFTLALHLPFEGRPSFAGIRDAEDLAALFADDFPDVVPLVPDLVEDYFTRPEVPMATIRCFPWVFGDGRVALFGDAAHAIVPSYGQGANAGFEDCLIFDRFLAETGGDPGRALALYQDHRKPDVDAIAQLALDHFKELFRLVGDDRFQLRKRIERRLDELRPDGYTSLYNLVSFTSISYLEALETDRRQSALVDRIFRERDIETLLESPGFRGRLDEMTRSLEHETET